MIKQLLEPRNDVLTGKLQGVVDIERVSDPRPRALEARVKDFFASTFVSGEVRQLIAGLNKRLNSPDAETGLFIAEGPKGEGKSHMLLVALHLVNSANELQDWLKQNGLEFNLPAGTRVIWRKFTDFPLESLWGVIADELKVEFPTDRYPNIDKFREAVGDRKLVLVFDELESGIRAIPNESLRQQNLNFLQMISEEANRAGSNIAVVASIYDGRVEPGLTLKRVARSELRFQNTNDRRKILFHRLFAKSPLDPSAEIDSIIQSHLNTWRRFGVTIPPDYPEDFRASYPFAPEVLEIVLERIRTSRGGFQGTRGALGFLAALIRARSESAHLITLSDASLLDSEFRSWLADLDPSQSLITCAEANLRELRMNPFSDQIASAVLLGSLAPSPKEQGIAEDELARQIIGPESDYNAFRISLTNFKKLGSYFHEKAGSLFFDTKENAHSKVNLRSLTVSDDEAWDKIVFWWANDILRDPDMVVFADPDTTRQTLDSNPNADLRVVAAPKKLSNDEIQKLYFGLKRRNTVILIEPRDEKIDLHSNADLLKYAKSWIAADNLARTAGDSVKSTEFSKIGQEDKRNAVDYLKKTNFIYVQIVRYDADPAKCEFQRENLPAAASREQITRHLTQTLYPATFVQEHIAGHVGDFFGKKVSQVETDYLNTPGFPLLMTHSVFHEALSALAEQGTALGLRHTNDNACGRRPRLTGDQLGDAVISEPFDVAPRHTPSPAPVAQPSGIPSSTVIPGEIFEPSSGPAILPTSETLSTGFLESRQLVRREIARLLDEHEGRKATRVKLALTFDERQTDVGTLPQFIRGSLTGSGKFGGEASLEFTGSFSKAQIEEMVERLPDFTPGSCRVTLNIEAVESTTKQETANV